MEEEGNKKFPPKFEEARRQSKEPRSTTTVSFIWNLQLVGRVRFYILCRICTADPNIKTRRKDITVDNIAEDGDQRKERKEAFAKGEKGRSEGRSSQNWIDRTGRFQTELVMDATNKQKFKYKHKHRS